MGGRLKWRGGVVALLAAASATAPSPGREPWWNIQWLYRRPVTVPDVPETHLAGEELAVVTMPTGGLIAPGGQDVCVTAASGQVVPHRVLMVGPGDSVRLAFALRRGSTKYFVYFGNPKAEPPKGELEIRRGVLMETWEYLGGAIESLPQAQRTFDRGGKLIGRDFRDGVFLGHNPFGPQNRICSLFTGYLVCPADGEYVFATSSRDASFLLVDGQPVVDNGGSHVPQRQADRQGRATLTKGLHELKVYHVNTLADPVVMAAWKPPDGRRLWRIEPDAFAPIRRAACGAIERYAREQEADFIPVHAGETFMGDRYFQRYAFEALLSGPVAVQGEFRWNFGDGQTSTRPKCDHVYLGTGPHKVTLTIRLAGQVLTRENTIHVARPWDRLTEDRLDRVEDHAKIVAGYDFAAASPEDLAAAIALFERAGPKDALLRAGDALVKRDRAPAAVVERAVPIYAESLAGAEKDPARAVAALVRGAEMTPNPGVRAALTIRAGQVALSARDADRALGLFEKALKEYAALVTAGALRDARIGVGDVHRLRSDYAKALEAYRSAGAAEGAGFEKEVVRQGDLARHVEDYLRRGLHHDAEEALDRWEWEFPADRLEGGSTLLRVRLALARKEYARAAEEALVLVAVNPRSAYAPELLMRGAEAYQALGKPDQARESLQRIVKEYPESPLAAQAARKLAPSP